MVGRVALSSVGLCCCRLGSIVLALVELCCRWQWGCVVVDGVVLSSPVGLRCPCVCWSRLSWLAL